MKLNINDPSFGAHLNCDKRVWCKCGRMRIWESTKQCRKCGREANRKWQKEIRPLEVRP